MSTLNHRAQKGFADGANYDRGRPTYSPTAVQLLLEKIRVSGKQSAKIVDLAAGTGKFTEVVASRPESYEIIAVEPHSEMREVLDQKGLPGTKVVDGFAAKMPLEDESVDAVICAQSFHWFADLDSLREIHRVLRPHGALGLVWNVDSFNAPQGHTPKTAWEEAVRQIYWSFDDERPRFRHNKWRAVFDEQIKSSPLALLVPSDQLFSLPLGEESEEWVVKLPLEKMWERFTTYSHIAVLEGEERENVHKKFVEAIENDKEARDEDGNVVLNGYTVMLWTTKIPTEGRGGLTEVERPGN